MKSTETVRKILSYYESDNPGTKANIARMLNTGRLAGTGKMVILPVDQGWEHGPARSFAPNPPAYDPHYLFDLAIESGCNAYAAPLGAIEAGAATYAGQIPLILKVNSSTTLYRSKEAPDQAIHGSVDDALRLGCSAIGFTVYPGSDEAPEMYEEIREMSEEAKSVGIATVIWSYPRGGNVSKDGETALDIAGYATYIAAALGAHVIKVKLPTDYLEQADAKKVYEQTEIPRATMAERVNHLVHCAFGGRRLIVFSGGASKSADAVYEDARAIRDGGGNGSIIGRNSFQRSKEEAVAMLNKIQDIYLGKE
ncbi:MAG: class I fructose-bisphosphate aldolase [Alphaproteobacteria bacterium]|jgi:class I fructose-bisphosphate aldolase|nr:class I fructose-bisphosphate aldolase [Alphaproteobacteria bacterium]